MPYLASIKSAYAQGIRRMVVDPGYTDASALLEYDDVLFMMGTYGLAVDDVFMNICRHGAGFDHMEALLERMVAVVGCTRVEGKRGAFNIVDLYSKAGFSLPHVDAGTPGDRDESLFDAIPRHLRDNRRLRWEDDLGRLLDDKSISLTAAKEAMGSRHDLKAFLATRKARPKSSGEWALVEGARPV
jgi:hypothetical protein